MSILHKFIIHNLGKVIDYERFQERTVRLFNNQPLSQNTQLKNNYLLACAMIRLSVSGYVL